jgi:hypothetical protein
MGGWIFIKFVIDNIMPFEAKNRDYCFPVFVNINVTDAHGREVRQ